MDTDERWMREALGEARRSARLCEVPVGALVVYGDRIVGRGANARELLADPTAHAEVMAIRQAAAELKTWRLNGCTIYVTKEPCPMCAGAMVLARMDRLVFGAFDPRRGAAGGVFQIADSPALNHRLSLTGGVLEEECAEILVRFFRGLRSERRDGREAEGDRLEID